MRKGSRQRIKNSKKNSFTIADIRLRRHSTRDSSVTCSESVQCCINFMCVLDVRHMSGENALVQNSCNSLTCSVFSDKDKEGWFLCNNWDVSTFAERYGPTK